VKKKVLIITYYWPPSGGGGVQRWLKFAKYLRDYNWEPVIYTVENGEYPEFDHTLEKDVPENLTIIKTKIWEPYLLYKKFIGQKSTDKINTGFLTEKKKPGLAERISVWLRGNLFIPDARKFWITPSIKYLLRYIPQNKINVVITTGPPHSLHLIGLKLKLQLNIKWLADFRDPWTNIDYYQDLKLTSYADKKHHNMEASVINNADVITVVGKTMKDEFEAAYKKKIEVITNGYDEHDIPDGNISLDKKFSIAHIGSMTKTRNPESLWQALRELVVEEKDFANHLQIELIGKADISVTESLTRNDLLKYFLKKDYLPHTQVTTAQQQAQVLLLVVNRTKNQKGILTGKLFEYILAKRPILCMGPVDGDAAEIIKDTNAGSVVHYDNKDEIKGIIKDYYLKFLKNELKAESSNTEKYSRKNLTGNLSQLLNNLTA
jgi:glycosyltransferase involved in cell wall biosynthesis